MNQRRIIFFSIFGAYHLILLLFTVYIDREQADFGLLSRMLYNISLFKYGAFVGFILFVIDFVWTWREKRSLEKDVETARSEVNTLKAKVYDFQEADKKRKQEAQSNTNE
ncbi:MAG: hypothetical protein AB7K37_12955 [Cyclobacteriaceae bacterium]